ncbi:MAG: RDD family protein [Tepidiformaceae bacterium]
MDCGFYIQPKPGQQREAAVMTASYATTALRAVSTEIEPGNLFLRCIANVLDSALLIGLMAAIVFVSMQARGDTFDSANFFSAAERISVLLFVLEVAFWTGFETSRLHATPFKVLFGLAVTDEAGEGLAFPHALTRCVVSTLLGTLFPIGNLFALFTAKKQTLADLITGTAVIER